MKSGPDPLVQRRAAGYLADLKDADSVPLLEDMLSEVLKRVAFGSFGVRSFEFQTRLAIAHALAKIGPTRIADRIWERYDRLDQQKKSEVPSLLNALGDPRLTEHLLEILDRCEDHQLMVGALEVLAIGGNAQALAFLRSKVAEWEGQGTEASKAEDSTAPLDYFVLRLRAEQAISQIEERQKGS
ncbi:MAG: HEAT repeat domain-containing protein [candidate division NC10 bacterium]|nr:HEAT repeat domain-containing protein [candidate division NC10 bacterium]